MIVHAMELIPGDKLTKNVFNQYGLHVLSAGTLLDKESIAKLYQHNIGYVDIERQSPHIQEPTEPKEELKRAYKESLDGFSQLFEQAMATGQLDKRLIDTSFESLVTSFANEKDLVSVVLTLEDSDTYTYQHSVQVGMLSYYISKWLGHSEEQALLTGKAGFMHDIGKSQVDPNILNKPGKLTAEEFEQMKKHTIYGYKILSAIFEKDSPVVLAALQHHERLDGSGYPLRLKESDIHPIAKIIAVADIYSAMISTRVYQKERDMLYVLRELHRVSFGEIDPLIAQVFLRNMVPHFIGKQVQLQSGEQGRIIMTHPTDYFRPLIMIDQEFIDLTRRPDLQIHKILL